MKKLLCCIVACFMALHALAQSFLIGTDQGLFDVSAVPRQIFSGISIYAIHKTDKAYFFLTDRGIMKSEDLHHYSFLKNALPKKTLKVEQSGKFVFKEQSAKLKDLAFHPTDSKIFVTATNNAVLLTVNGGASFQNLGTFGYTNGIKAVAVAHLPDATGAMQLTVFVATAVSGLAWKQPYISNVWHDANDGLAKGPESPDEVSDILIKITDTNEVKIFLAQTFKSRLYEFNWKYKLCTLIETYNPEIDNAKYLDSLNYSSNFLAGVKENGIFITPLLFPQVVPNSFVQSLSKNITKSLIGVKLKANGIFDNMNCAYIDKGVFNLSEDLRFTELFALRLNEKKSTFADKANHKKAVYIPWTKADSLNEYISLIKENNLNAVVIDMKDDYGYIRYNSTDINVTKYGAVRNNIELEDFVKKLKENGIYIIARLVIFKDQRLYNYNNGAYAVKDITTGENWRGFDIDKDGNRDYYYEYWVDPYNEQVWKYNAAIANELVRRGVDEIQFDYIRFPTDGDNLRNTYYPAQQHDMDKESAIMSFLAYAREHIPAPISIDIYGANGWYRTGARTGQEVEMLASYVDVICPMYYPSHFAQSFLAYEPKQERPYRIYSQGAYRAWFISRNTTIIRPWAQCFFLNVSYDRQFYGAYYIKSQLRALQDTIDQGFSLWNTVGNYSDLPQLE